MLQATAEAVWEALKAAPGPEDLNNGPRITLAAKLMPHRCTQWRGSSSLALINFMEADGEDKTSTSAFVGLQQEST